MVIGLTALVIGVGSYFVPEVHAYTADAFVMVVKTDNPGTSNATSFTIPITGTGYSYNVDCNDDGVNEVTARTTSYTCVYGAAGTYTVAITGTFPRVYFNNAGDRQKLLEVKQWGTGAWTSMANAFYGCNNLHVTATDAPNLAGVTNLSRMFSYAISFNESINHWNTATITNMSYMFDDGWDKLMAFNQPLNNWNTSAVTNMSYMFQGAAAFNQPIGAWDTGNVTNMSYMFNQASSFNQPIGGWNTSKLTDVRFMFNYALAFDQPIDGWNTIALLNMQGMLQGASSFNQPLNSWNTSGVTNMNQVFSGATAFDQPLDGWITDNVTTMSSMFSHARSFNKPLNSWNTSKVTDMSYLFSSYGGFMSFNQPLNNWNTSAVTNMSNMFQGATSFNQPLDTWDTSKVTNMRQMFSQASAFNQPLTGWNTSAVTYMSNIFSGASSFNQPLTGWNTGAVTDMSYIFQGATSFNQPLDTWDTSKVTNMRQMFSQASAFNQPLTGWNTSAVTDMNQMFYRATAFNRPLAGWNISAVTDMSGMFDQSGYTTATYDQTLAYLASQTLRSGVPLGAAGLTYCNDSAHITLTSAPNNWTITDGGFCPPTITSPTPLQVVTSATPTITGTAYPSRVVHVTLDGTDFATTAQADGNFEYPVVVALTGGWHTVVVRSTDQSGALGIPRQVSFYIHTGGSVSLDGLVQRPTLSWDKAPGTATATVWSETAVGATSFTVRGSFGVASLNGKLWVAGGLSTGNVRLNDVWSSTDGTTWLRTLANAPWTARNAHTVTAFNGKLWVIGGQRSSGSNLNDIWSSTDGITWTQEVANAPWTARASHEVVVHDNKLWLIGGTNAGGSDLTDIWSSPDGVNWTQVTASATWPSRRGFAAASFNGKLWVMGGLINNWSAFTSDVWSSTDGATWTEETATAAWQVRASHQVEVFDDKLWVLGGSADDWDSEYSDVWFSENGKDWIRTTEAADWTARRGHSSAVFNNQLWVLGGRVGTAWTLSNDVWSAGIPATTYTICWDTIAGGCAHTATTTDLSFTLPDNLAKDTWHFNVKATGPSAQSLGSFTASPYTVTDPVPVSVPLAPQPVIHPNIGVASTAKLSEAMTSATLSVASYDCSDLQTASVHLVEPDGLKAPEANVTLIGGVGFSVGCTSNGKSADVSLALGANYSDTSKLRAYKQSGANLVDITKQVAFTNKDINGTTKTVASYNLVDGGSLDEDGAANGTLVDPIFIGVIDGAGGSLANTGFNVYALLALAAAFLTSAAAIWRKGVKAIKRVSFR